MWLIEFELP